MIRWTGLAPWGLEFSFPGTLASKFLRKNTMYSFTSNLSPNGCSSERIIAEKMWMVY
jgi:hypothetical protein